MRSLLKPWLFVLVGVCLSIGSAVITNAFIAEKNRQLMGIERDCNDIEKQIDQHWQQAKSLEYEEHTGTIILLFSSLTEKTGAERAALDLALGRYVEKILLSGRVPPEETTRIREMMKKKEGSAEALSDIFSMVDKNRIETIKVINDLYSKKQEFERQETRLRGQISKFSSIALFLQVMGLIFVLAKDLVHSKREAISAETLPENDLNFS